MSAQTTFARIEKKYLLTPQQYHALSGVLAQHLEPDAYGRYSIGNIYYDTGDYALVRHSLEKPVYKEKLRLRSYGVPGDEDITFLELKKKYKGMLVNGNLGTGIAVMGAFSLVRFRSLPGTAREIGSIFLAMAIGLATGTGYLGIAAIFTLILGAAQFALSYLHFGETQTGDKTLKVTIPEGLDYEGAFDDLFQKYTRSVSLEKVKTSNMGSLFELEYRLTPAAEQSEKEFLDALRTRNGNLPISISRTATVREDLL